MVKILKKSKKPLSTHPKVNAIILAIQDVPDDELPAVLNAVHYWHWPRTDLHFWIKPLNRFDSILEEICKSYNVTDDHVQTSEFTPRTKELILAILKFTRLLLENATNRKLYASFDRMNDLLLTQDLDVLEATLRLILRRAQQIASNGTLQSGDTFNLTQDRVADLTKGWKSVRHAGLSMYELVKGEISPAALSEVAEVNFQFYRKASSLQVPASPSRDNEPAGDALVMTPAATPAPKSAARGSKAGASVAGPSTPAAGKGQPEATTADQEGMTTINLGRVADSGKSATDILIDAMDLYRIPKEEKLHLFQRIRLAMAIDDPAMRQQVLRIRLLAVSVLVHTSEESVAEAAVFLYEPKFISQVAELVHPNKAISMEVRTVAMLTLDTCSRIGNKVTEVTSALSVSINHGTLMSILRKLASDLNSEHPETTSEYVDALFTFLNFLQSTGFAGNMLLGAGAIPLLIDLVKESKLTHDALLVANRAVTFLDNYTYSFPNAAGPFASAGGLQVFVNRVRQLVAAGVDVANNHSSMDAIHSDSIKTSILDEPGTLSYGESTLVKSLFRCLQRLMNSGQNTEGVRQLIDSSLVESCKLVMQNRHAFGPQNFALAVTIMLTFVHNEPTSLGVLQENKVPDAFYEAIRSDIEPSLDVLSVIPTAIGALCLNEAGLEQFQKDCLDIIEKLFSSFLSEKHARVLNERENAVIIGANFDELVRHHPSLKQPVFDAITKLLKDMLEQGKNYVPETSEGYRLLQVKDGVQTLAPSAATNEAEMDEASTSNGPAVSSGEAAPAIEEQSISESRKEDNSMLTSVAVTGRFLEGFFTTPSHCKDYIKKDGLDHLLQLFTLPCIPFDLHFHAPYPGLTTVFLTISEHSPHHLLKALLGQAKEALTTITDIWKPGNSDTQPIDTAKLDSLLCDMLQPTSIEATQTANTKFRAIVRTQLLVTIMSELHSTDSYVSRQPSSQVLSFLRAPEEMKALQDLCALQRASTYLNVKLKASIPNAAKAATSSSGATPGVATAEATESTEPLDSAMVGTGIGEMENKVAVDSWSELKSKNAKAMKQVLFAISDSLKNFLQGIMGLHATRRAPIDSQQRKDATFVAHAIALGVAQCLRWPESSDRAIDFEYATLMVKFMADLLHAEQRSSSGGLHLIFLKALDKQEGTDRLILLYRKYTAEVAQLTQTSEDQRDAQAKLRLIHAVGGLKVLLGVLEVLTNHRVLLSPGHLLLLTQDRSSQSFFDPHAFLVKLRAKLLPPLVETWNSDYLAPSPPIIVRAVFRILMRILEAQGETGDHDSSSSYASTLPGRPIPGRQAVASPVHVQSLVDMGFPRTACEQALLRRGNNITTAVDYLMSHPEVVAAARARETAAAQTPAGSANEEASAENPAATAPAQDGRDSPADVDMTDAPSGAVTPAPVPEEGGSSLGSNVSDGVNMTDILALPTVPGDKAKGKTPVKKHSKADLDAQRDALKKTFVQRALTLAQNHGELVFDIKEALQTVNFNGSLMQENDPSRGLDSILVGLTELLKSGTPSTEEANRGVAARMRLIALLFSDPTFRRSADATYERAMQPVLQLVQDYNGKRYALEQRPQWLSSVMLLGELILARAELPKDSTSAEALEIAASTKSSPLRGLDFASERHAIFDMCLDVLKKGLPDRDTFQSTFRLLLLLTRRHDFALKLVEQDGLPALMKVYDQGRKDKDGFQAYATMILRHVIEDKEVVKSLMDIHVGNWLGRVRRSADSLTYTKELNSSACRDTSTFLETTGDLCKLVDSTAGYAVTRKDKPDTDKTASAAAVPEATSSNQAVTQESNMQVDDLTKALPSSPAASSASVDAVMHFLIAEAMAATTAVLAGSGAEKQQISRSAAPSNFRASDPNGTAQDTAQVAAPTATSTDSATAPVEAEPPQTLRDFTYASFVLGTLSELVASYLPCKLSLLNYQKRRDTNAQQNKHAKGKHSFLYYILHTLIPTGALIPGKEPHVRKRFAISWQAMGLLESLCADRARNITETKATPASEITDVRRSVLEGIARAFREGDGPAEHMDAKYGRLCALSHICARFLLPQGSANTGIPRTSPSDMPLQIAKIMLEKNYASILTNALIDIDFNYPEVENLINAILTPLDALTKLVSKLSRTLPAENASEVPSNDANVEASTVPTAAPEYASEDDESGSEDVDMDDAEQDGHDAEAHDDQEASDVYRNSALGMFQGELEPANAEEAYSSDDDMDEDMDGYDDGDDLMEEEGAVPSDVSDESDGEDEDMEITHELEDELDEDDDPDGDSTHSEDEQDEDDDDDDDEHDGRDELEELDDGPDIQADLTAALHDGRLEAVDDFTSRMLNEQMDMFGEPGDGGLMQAHFDHEGPLDEDFEGNLEEGEAPEGEDDEEDDDEGQEVAQDEEGGGADVAEIFDNLLGGHGGALDDPNVHVSVMRPNGGERILSIDIGGPPPASLARRSGPRAQQSAAIGQHALLTDSNETSRRGGRGDFMGNRHRHRTGRHAGEYSEWLQSIEDLIGNGAGQLLEQVFGNMQAGAQGAALRTGGGADARGTVGLLQSFLNGVGSRAGQSSRHRHSHLPDSGANATHAEASIVDEYIANAPYTPSSTVDRWNDESTIFSGGMQASERIAAISKLVTSTLLPEKQARDREQREKDEKEKAERAKEIEERVAREAAEAAERQASTTVQEQAPVTGRESETANPETTQSEAPAMHELAEGPATPASTGPADQPSWRVRLERRRQLATQGTAGASSAESSSEEASNTPSQPSRQAGFPPALQNAGSESDAVSDIAQVLNLAAQFAAAGSAPEATGSNASAPGHEASPEERDTAMDGVEEISSAQTVSNETAAEGNEADMSEPSVEEPEAGPSAQAERVTIQIRGNTVDITDTGIDPTFLEALPDDMREEVLNQHFRESRAAAAPTRRDIPSSINAEFLEALPEELRAEVLAQEAIERARTRQTAAPAATGETGATAAAENGAEAPANEAAPPMEVDPATFLASLDPQLRQTVLLEQGEEMLGALPPDILEEYRALRNREMREHALRDPGYRRHMPRRPDLDAVRNAVGGSGTRRAAPAVKRDAIQLLDKPGVAALVRLLFFPPALKKHAISSILINLCENAKTRTELLNLLLTVLHDGTREAGAGGELIDRAFTSIGPSGYFPPSAAKNPKSASKGKNAAPATPNAAQTPFASHFPGLPQPLVASGPGDNIPHLVVQRALESLSHLVGTSEGSARFFLTEQELPINLNSTNKRSQPSGKRDKGKGRASEVAPAKDKVYPIIVLLSLLDRQGLASSPTIMEALTKLLANITAHLRHNMKKLEELQRNMPSASSTSETPNVSAPTGPPASTSSAAAETSAAGPSTSTASAGPKTELEIRQAEIDAIPSPPQLPAHYVKMVVNVLDLGECSARLFSATLALIHNLWYVPDARAVILTELVALAQKYGGQLLGDLNELGTGLQAPKASDGMDTGTAYEEEVLLRFSQASSNQAKLLRVLKVMEHAKQSQTRALKRRRDDLERQKKEAEAKEAAEKKKADEAAAAAAKAASHTKAETNVDENSGDQEAKPVEATEAATVAASNRTSEIRAALEVVERDEEAHSHKVEELYEGFDFSPVWTKLSDCLSIMEEGEEVGARAGTLLPLIEAFLLVASWGLEGVEANGISQDTPVMQPSNRMRASLSPAAQAVII